MMKNIKANEMLAICALLTLLLAASFFLPARITGKIGADNDLYVSIRDRMEVEITLFGYSSVINITNTQNISIEITDSGSKEYDARISEYIYNLTENNTMNLLASYYDSSVHLYPGGKRDHKVVFVPPSAGIYFIKLSVNYGPRIKEVWGSFTVLEPGTQQQGNGTGAGAGNGTGAAGGAGAGGGGGAGAGGGGGAGPVTIEEIYKTVKTSMSLEYPKNITAYKNTTTLFSIKVINTDIYDLMNVNLFLSSPDVFETDINPKSVQTIHRNASLTYVISIKPKDTVNLGEYKIDFDVTSMYSKGQGSITVDVKDITSLIELIQKKILNYEFLISEISAEIEAAANRGYDTAVPGSYIDYARQWLDRVKEHLNSGDYDSALYGLGRTEDNIKQAAFTLGNITIVIVKLPEVPYYLIIAAIAIILLILFFIYKRRKKKRKKPKLLERSGE